MFKKTSLFPRDGFPNHKHSPVPVRGRSLLGEFCWTACPPTWEVLQRGKPHGPEVLVTWRFVLELKIALVFVITFAGRALAMSTASLETSAAEVSPRDDRRRSVRQGTKNIRGQKEHEVIKRMIVTCLAKVGLASVSSSWIVE